MVAGGEALEEVAAAADTRHFAGRGVLATNVIRSEHSSSQTQANDEAEVHQSSILERSRETAYTQANAIPHAELPPALEYYPHYSASVVKER